MENKTIKVIARNSPLSLLQVKELFSLFPTVQYQLEETATYGDVHKEISLMSDVAGDIFTRELDQAVLSGQVDIAVHSAKDLPYPLPIGLELYCLTEASDQSDSLLSRGSLTLAELPSGSRIGTSSKTRKAELEHLRKDIEIVAIRGTIEERIAQVDNGYVDALIVATCALNRLGLSGRISEKLHFRTHPLQGNLAVIGVVNRPELKASFSAHDIRKRFGQVTLVGFGPGNPELLTLAGDKALKEADVIFHDDLVDKAYLNKYQAEKVYVGKRKGKHSHHQDEINELIYRAALSGRAVVRLKGGDPMVFAHGREEIDYMQSRFVRISVIPGISSGMALSAYTHIPLTHRGVASSFAFVTGHEKTVQTPSADTLVYYMGGAHLADIGEALIRSGRRPDLPVALVTNVSLSDQQIFFSTLKELQFTFARYPTPILVIIGEVVAFESSRSRQAVLFTGTMAPSSTDREVITHIPLVSINKKEIVEEVISSLQLTDYDWIVFTSRYGVRYFFELLNKVGMDIRRLSSVKIASVGPVTSDELLKRHICPDLESSTESAEGLIAWFTQEGIVGKRILLPRSDKGMTTLSDKLEQIGNQVTNLVVYENTPHPEVVKVDLSHYDKILFSSPSGVESFKNRYIHLPDGIPLVGKGKTTSNKLKKELYETFQRIKEDTRN
ncbi:uroporphyrinogen-III C-methyltransferase [Bacteroides sp.]|uniref:uroporphyrinogen-III C-methyltransferase n=1 Tax=Bacteroides sp. TaxID=29523 RepID=UPI002FC8336C